MSTKKSLSKNQIWMLAGNVTHAACQFLTVVVLSRVSGAEVAGAYAYAFSIIQPVFAFCALELRSVQATDAKDEFTFSNYVALRVITIGIALAVVAGVAAVSVNETSSLITLCVLSLVTAIDNLFDLMYGALQKVEEISQLAISMVLRSAVSLAALALVFIQTQNLAAACIALLVARSLTLLPLISRFLRDRSIVQSLVWSEMIDFRRMTSLARVSAPFAVLSGVVALRLSCVRLLIWHFSDAYTLGVYTALTALNMPFDLVIRSAYQAAMPRIAKLYHAADRDGLNRIITQIYVLTAGMFLATVVGLALLADELMRLLFGIEATDATPLLMLLTFATALRAATRPAGVVARSARRVGPMMVVHCAGTIVLMCCGGLLIAEYGLLGAAVGQVAAAATILCASIFLLTRYLSFPEQTPEIIPLGESQGTGPAHFKVGA